MDLGISFGIDEVPADPGDNCTRCKEPISGTKYCAYLQCGFVQDAKYVTIWCEKCYCEVWKEDEKEPPR